MSFTQIAIKTGISQRTLSNWRTEEKNPSPEKLNIFCENLDFDIDNLIMKEPLEDFCKKMGVIFGRDHESLLRIAGSEATQYTSLPEMFNIAKTSNKAHLKKSFKYFFRGYWIMSHYWCPDTAGEEVVLVKHLIYFHDYDPETNTINFLISTAKNKDKKSCWHYHGWVFCSNKSYFFLAEAEKETQEVNDRLISFIINFPEKYKAEETVFFGVFLTTIPKVENSKGKNGPAATKIALQKVADTESRKVDEESGKVDILRSKSVGISQKNDTDKRIAILLRNNLDEFGILSLEKDFLDLDTKDD